MRRAALASSAPVATPEPELGQPVQRVALGVLADESLGIRTFVSAETAGDNIRRPLPPLESGAVDCGWRRATAKDTASIIGDGGGGCGGGVGGGGEGDTGARRRGPGHPAALVPAAAARVWHGTEAHSHGTHSYHVRTRTRPATHRWRY